MTLPAADPAAQPAAPGPAPAARAWQLLALSAASEAALEAETDRVAERLRPMPAEEGLAALARELQASADGGGAHRRTVVARDAEDAATALAARDPQRVFTAVAETDARPVVFLFPGLGEQYVGMARGLYRAEPVFRAAFDRAADVLRPETGADLGEVVPPPAPEKEEAAGGGLDLRAMLLRAKAQGDAATKRLNRTELAQPAVFATEVALAELLLSWGVRPAGMVGHSLGEYAAAAVAGALPLEGALALVARRARMIDALPGGVMLAVPLPEEEVRAPLGAELDLAAVNAPHACVVSGPAEAVAALEARLTEQGVTTSRLATTHAFHSRMLEPITGEFAAMVRAMALGEPRLPLVSNVTGRWMSADEARDPGYWVRHLLGTVRFSDGVQVLAEDPQRVFLEVGPGQTLGAFARQAGAVRQIVLPTLRPGYVRHPDDAFLLGTLGRLWLAGVPVDWKNVTRE